MAIKPLGHSGPVHGCSLPTPDHRGAEPTLPCPSPPVPPGVATKRYRLDPNCRPFVVHVHSRRLGRGLCRRARRVRDGGWAIRRSAPAQRVHRDRRRRVRRADHFRAGQDPWSACSRRSSAAFRTTSRRPSDYEDLLKLLYGVFQLTRREGMLALESHLESSERERAVQEVPVRHAPPPRHGVPVRRPAAAGRRLQRVPS